MSKDFLHIQYIWEILKKEKEHTLIIRKDLFRGARWGQAREKSGHPAAGRGTAGARSSGPLPSTQCYPSALAFLLLFHLVYPVHFPATQLCSTLFLILQHLFPVPVCPDSSCSYFYLFILNSFPVPSTHSCFHRIFVCFPGRIFLFLLKENFISSYLWKFLFYKWIYLHVNYNVENIAIVQNMIFLMIIWSLNNFFCALFVKEFVLCGTNQ